MVLEFSNRNSMRRFRRRSLRLAAVVSALATVPSLAGTQPYPTQPVRLIVGYPAGGASDITARVMGQWLSERLGQPFVIDNRSGAGTNIATETVVRASPDGYTLLMVTAANAINATLYERLSFYFTRDVAPVAGIIRMQNVLEVNPAVPAKTVPELIAYAKANPDKLNMASAGIGSPSHVAGELFNMMAGVSIRHVPYRGGAAALTDLLSGQVQVMFDNLATALEHIKAGRVRPLAVTAAVRSDMLPDLPAVSEFVPGYEASSWFGLGAPKATPREIIDILNKEINAGLADPRINARLAELGGSSLAGSPADFARLIAAETEKWGRVVKFSGAQPE